MRGSQAAQARDQPTAGECRGGAQQHLMRVLRGIAFEQFAAGIFDDVQRQADPLQILTARAVGP
ncbi:hypothetical protein D3C76_1428490 [compost metagenome]